MISDNFMFDGELLSDYGYIVCSMNGINDDTTDVSNIVFNTIKTRDTSKKVSSEYSENLSRTIQIMKTGCNGEELSVTDEDLSTMSQWLCRKNYKWFKWEYKDNDDAIYYEAKINLKKIELGYGVIGLELDIETNRPYGLTKEFTYVTSSNTFTIPVVTDDEGYLYPDVIIKCKSAGNLVITNSTENRKTIINNCSNNEEIKFYGNILQLESNIDSHELYSNFNYNYPRFYTEFDNRNNVFNCNIDADITIKYRGVRKVGL